MGAVQPLASPAGLRDALVLGAVTHTWTGEFAIAREVGLTVGVTRVSLTRLFEAGRVQRRPAVNGTEWKRK